MKILMTILAGAVAFGLTAAAPAFAAGEQTTVSAAQKHKRVKRAAAPRRARPEDDFYFIGDVTGSCKVQRDAGACVVNLGYGRCEACNVGGER